MHHHRHHSQSAPPPTPWAGISSLEEKLDSMSISSSVTSGLKKITSLFQRPKKCKAEPPSPAVRRPPPGGDPRAGVGVGLLSGQGAAAAAADKGQGWDGASSSPSSQASRYKEYNGQIVLVGASGAGKTKTILHLFNHNRDLGGLQTSDHKSATSATNEFILHLNSIDKRSVTANQTTLSIVDTPGYGDSRGLEQDARNLACNKRFLEKLNGNDLPNLVLFVLRADENRYLDDQSIFARSLSIYFDPEMGLTDESGSNVLIVLTHALNISQSNANWAGQAMKKMKSVQDFVYEKRRCRPPVVILENEVEGVDRVKRDGEWTILPDGKTMQPMNMFKGMMELFERNNDLLGKMVTEIFFSRTTSHSIIELEEGESVRASTGGNLDPLENEYYERLKSVVLQTKPSPPRESMSSGEKVQQYVSSQWNQNTSRSSLGSNISLSTSNPPMSPPMDNDDSGSVGSSASTEVHYGPLIGREYDLGGDGRIMDHLALNKDKLKGEIQRTTINETSCESLDYNNRKRVLNQLGLAGEVPNLASGSGSVQGQHTSSKISGSEVLKIMVTKVTVSDEVRSTWHSKEYLSDSLRADLKKLPSSYKKNVPTCKEKFRKFFHEHGQGFVMTGYYGGEAICKLRRRAQGEELALEGSVSGSKLLYSAKGEAKRATQQLGTSNNYTVNFRGGDPRYHHYEKLDKWQKSVQTRDLVEMVRDVKYDVKLYHMYLREFRSPDLSSRAKVLEEAFRDLYLPMSREQAVKEEGERNEAMIQAHSGSKPGLLSKIRYLSFV